MRWALVATSFWLALGAFPGGAQVVLTNPAGDQLVLTDPMVRTAQLGYTPVGTLTGWDARTGVGLAQVAGAGTRQVRLFGQPVATAAGVVVGAVDLASGIQLFVVLPPQPEQLVPATVLRVTTNGVTVRRRGSPAIQAEILPPANLFVARGGRTLPATLVSGSLKRGATVLIPAVSGARGAIEVRGVPSQKGPAALRSGGRRPSRPTSPSSRY